MSSGQATPQDSQSNTEAPSPSRQAFKVQKTTSRPQSSRKQSFDPANFERMNMNSINIIPFEQRPQGIPLPFADGYGLPATPQSYGFAPQYANIQAQFDHTPTQAAPQMFPTVSEKLNGFSKQNALENVVESPLATLGELTTNSSKGANEVASCCAPPAPITGVNAESNGETNGNSCCAPKQPSHSHSSSSTSSVSEPPEMKFGSCCSSALTTAMKQESISIHGTPVMTPQMLPPNGMTFNSSLYSQYLPQTTVFTYPATYGSFQNPLQPYAWRQSVRANSFGHTQMQDPLLPGSMPFEAPVVQESLDTVHTCRCGDGCQCVGCAAHPYNDATQDYVRSAWSMNMEQAPSDVYAKEHSNSNGHPTPAGGEMIASPTMNTPSSTTSGNGEEQNFSAADFFFVSYPFSSEEGCGGDTESCPCGDDCQCFGCAIHQNPGIPCEGQKDVCPCGDDCECIGCEIHNGTVKV
ncbi:mac1 [Hyphodiscus hymeniophilus]|uniref:Mac1 n=1 Tax=Hyphodiscus hymeniophilus TaxID=353542 RepID=A0A9P6VLG4_9HELO|nr:mac1 [Hyphodiscus hymeniophilus]